METYDKPTVTSSSTDQGLTPAHYSRETRRNIAKNLRNIATVTLLVALLYHYTQVADVFSTQMRPQQGGTTCNASTTQAEPEFDWYDLKPSEDIQWTPCFDGQRCARLSLPLDYMTPDGPKTEIAMRMIPATDKENYKGTILINPGGPGGSGTEIMQTWGQNISKVVGKEFDILGFDPRGTGATTPPARCFKSTSQLEIWKLQDGPLLNSTGNSISMARAREIAMAELCAKALGGSGKEDLNSTAEEWGPGRFMSTASVATDMLRIVEKLGQEKLQYWGFSYGTVLGQYFAAMYPDKIGRLIIDGVYDATEYRAGLWFENLEDTDKVLASFFEFCHQAGPSKCKVYAPTVQEIERTVGEIIKNLSQAPIPMPFAPKGPSLFTKKTLHMLMFSSTYSPLSDFKFIAETLVAIKTQNTTTLALAAQRLSQGAECNCKETIPWLAENEAFYAIACGDIDKLPPDGPGDFVTHLDELSKLSPFASPIWGIHYLQCSHWKLNAKWRYTGPFAAQNTSHPMLILSAKFDPVCPLKHAQAVQKRYKQSALLVQNSYGHCTIKSPSLCTAKNVRAYFVNGTVPEEGTVCEVEELPFIGAVNESMRTLSAGDAELLDALKGLASIGLPKFGNF